MNRRGYMALMTSTIPPVLAGCNGEINGSGEPATQTPTPPEFALRSLTAPSEVTQPETIPVEIEIENLGESDGTYEGVVDISWSVSARAPLTRKVDAEIPAGESRTITTDIETTYASGFVRFQIGDFSTEVMITPESPAPRELSVSLLTEWEEFGDVYVNAIRSASVGETITIGVRYEYWHGENGTHDVFIEYEIRDANGIQVAVPQDQSERLTDQRGWGEWEQAIDFPTEGLDPGEYTVEVQVRNNRTDDVSSPATDTFDLQ